MDDQDAHLHLSGVEEGGDLVLPPRLLVGVWPGLPPQASLVVRPQGPSQALLRIPGSPVALPQVLPFHLHQQGFYLYLLHFV